MKSLISIMDLDERDINALMDTADDIVARPGAYAHKMAGKKLASLFFEPSTRTRLTTSRSNRS